MIIQLILNLTVFMKLPENIYDYDLQVMISKLAFEPSAEYVLKSYAVCAAIIIIFNLAGWLVFKKSEIK